MEGIQARLAENLSALRAARHLSLDRCAGLTGLSKSMLGQIERGESNPSLQTLWKIANGLHVSLASLVDGAEPGPLVVSVESVEPALGDGGRFRVYPLFPFREDTRFEILAIEMDAGSTSDSEAHAPGTVEYLLVTAGTVGIEAGQGKHSLHAGEAIRYRADRPHAYRNEGRGRAEFRMVMFYPG